MLTRPGQLLIGGALLVGGIMGIYYTFRKKDRPSSQKAISKDLLIKILKEIEGERYLLYKKITPLCKQEYESRKAQMSLEDFTLSIFEEYQTNLNFQFAIYENRVLKRHKVLHTDYFEALNITHKDDEDIKTLLDESNIRLKQALQGEFRVFTDKLPSVVTPEFMVELWGKVKKRTLKAMYKAVTEKGLKEDSKEIDEIDRETQVGVYHEEGLGELDEAADKIVQSGFYKYSREYPGFSEKIYQIDMKSIEVLTLLFAGGSDIEAKIETIGEKI